jgi:hypothetical protein
MITRRASLFGSAGRDRRAAAGMGREAGQAPAAPFPPGEGPGGFLGLPTGREEQPIVTKEEGDG